MNFVAFWHFLLVIVITFKNKRSVKENVENWNIGYLKRSDDSCQSVDFDEWNGFSNPENGFRKLMVKHFSLGYVNDTSKFTV